MLASEMYLLKFFRANTVKCPAEGAKLSPLNVEENFHACVDSHIFDNKIFEYIFVGKFSLVSVFTVS